MILKPGTKVIVVSNSNPNVQVGYYEGHGADGTVLNVPRLTIDGKTYLCMGIVVPYFEELESFLRSLTTDRAWELMSQMMLCRDELSSWNRQSQ